MKIIDIHTKKQVEDNSHYKNEINGEFVKEYVFKNIDFVLIESHWDEINQSFADVWNNELGIGKDFYWDEITNQIFNQLQNKKILIEFERVNKIVDLMLTCIKDNGGFLE